ncbi:hypothetical protein IEO21_10440 [Rhodonia placenta]|uniref:Uncharacterized protein n=1 Tax=Rhodonia placenta TaxID=104341 RepID=A0A8H7NSH0_9APHY|nr:hypothetical protein IEO21_10440 [Postia placenta]
MGHGLRRACLPLRVEEQRANQGREARRVRCSSPVRNRCACTRPVWRGPTGCVKRERECGSYAQRKQSWITYAPVREKRTPVSVRERVCIGEESGPAFLVCCGGCMEDARERQQLDNIHTRNEIREDCSEEGVVAEGAAWSMGGRCIEDVTTE